MCLPRAGACSVVVTRAAAVAEAPAAGHVVEDVEVGLEVEGEEHCLLVDDLYDPAYLINIHVLY